MRWPFRKPPQTPTTPTVHHQLWVLPNSFSCIWQKSLYLGTDFGEAVQIMADSAYMVHKMEIRSSFEAPKCE